MANFGIAKIWHHFLNATANFDTKFPGCGTRRSIDMFIATSDGPLVGCWYFLFLGFPALAVFCWPLLEACCLFGPSNTVV